jgi:DNA-binding response OmpR family regulator
MKLVVLMSAGTAAAAEARQLALGADCVLRDPVRVEVLAEYLAKYIKTSRGPDTHARPAVPATISFAGATVDPVKRRLDHGNKSTALTPREVQLVELFVSTAGGMVTYELLYVELLGRRFRGDTSNMRVLFGKLSTSAESVGISLRHWIEVIPKTGYRYASSPRENVPASKKRGARLLTAA